MLEIILITIIALIILIISIGIDISGNFKKESSKLELNFKVMILRSITIYKIKYPKNEEKKEDDKKENDYRNIIKLIEPCISSFLEFLKSFIKSINVRTLESHVDLGLSSYVDTAKYVGYAWAILVFVNSYHKNANISAAPHFGEVVFDFKGTVDIRINIIKLIIPLIRLLKDKNVLKLIKSVI